MQPEPLPVPLPPQPATPVDAKKVSFGSVAAGFAVGATLASFIWGLIVWEQHRRHQVQLVQMGVVAATPAAVLDTARQFLGGGSAAPAKSETPPTQEDIATYLDGKTLPLPDSDEASFMPGGKSSKSCVMKKDGVEAVQKGNGFSYGGEPTSTPVTILYNSGDGRYAVEATILHKPVGDKTAFFGFTLTRVARQ